MKSIEVSARTIEEAIGEGLNRLKCAISDCKVEILSEGAKGLFGFFGSKPASVRLTLLSESGDDDDLGIDLSLPAQDELRTAQPAKPAKPAQEKKAQPAEKPAAVKAAVPYATEKKAQPAAAKSSDVMERFKNAPLPGAQAAEPAPAAPKRPARQRPERPARPAPREREERYEDEPRHDVVYVPVEAPEHIEVHAEDTLQGRAQQFLLELTKRMGVSVQVDVTMNAEGQMTATMYGDTLGILIGRRGETLDALQYLTSLQVNHGQAEYTRVTLDTENYRAKREEALTRLASRMASRAVKTGRKVSLEPMNPYERRILHASLQGNPNVSTHSEGDEPYRHVVVVPEK